MNGDVSWPLPAPLPTSSSQPSPAVLSVAAPPRSPDIPLLSPPSASLRGRLSFHDELRSYCIRGVPGWLSVSPSDVELTQMKKGMTNQLFIAERRDAGAASSEYAKVVVRVFGADTSTFFDREYEEYITRRLSKRGIGSRILTEFGSGRIEAFLDGRTLDCADLSDPRISYLAARALATLHSKHIPITATLIDNAKRKVQRDARKLLPPIALLQQADGHNGLRNGSSATHSAEDNASSPPSSPSHSLSSMSAVEQRSLPDSPVQRAADGRELSSALPLLHSAADSDGTGEGATASSELAVDSEDGLAYQEPLLYFRIHHWFNVARRLDFTPALLPDSSSPLAGFSLAQSAHTKHELFHSMQLSSARVEWEEQWLIDKLRSLHSLIVFCLSEDTEVLTDHGFMSRAEVFAACPELAPSSPTAAPASDSAALPFGGAVHTRTTSPLYWTPSRAEMEAAAAAGVSYEQLVFGGTSAALRDLAGRYGRRCALCKKTVWSSCKKGAYTLLRKHTRSAHSAEVAQAAPAVAPRSGRVSVTSAASASSASRAEVEEGEEVQQVSQPGPRAAPPAPSTSLRFASLDPSTGHLVYLPATALVWKTVASLVEFTDAAEAPSWAENADEYGLTPDQVERMEARSARARAGERFEKEEYFHATCRSNGVSLRVDRMHDMYVRVGMADTVQINWADEYVKVKAGSLVSDDAQQRVRLTGQATAGFDASAISDDELSFIAALGLSTAQVDTFLWLYGYWLGDGYLDVQQRAVVFAPKRKHDKDEVKKRLEALGFTVPSDAVRVYPASNGQLALMVMDQRWRDYFFGEYSPKYGVASVSSSRPHTHTGLTTHLPKSVKWFWMWVWRLRKARARLVLAGLRCADGEEANDVNRICTSGVAFRDDLVRLALHAGYAARFDIRYKKDNHRGYTESSEPLEAKHDNWAVSYSDCPAAAEPILYNQRDIKEVKEPTGAPVPVWCVTVPPHHLIIARRVRKNDSGVVTLAGKALVVGNCHNDLQEGNLILEANAHKHERTRRRKKSRTGAAAAVGTVESVGAATTPKKAVTLHGAVSHMQAGEQCSGSSTLSDETARPSQLQSRPASSLVVDVTHRPISFPPAREVSVAADVSFEELQPLMHSPQSPLSPESSPHTRDASDSAMRDSFDALRLDQQQQHFNALLSPDAAPDSARLCRSSPNASPTSAACSSPYSAWRLHMIDFEYSSYNPRAFDLANHVCEHYIDYALDTWPGFAIRDQHFPSDHHIRRFLTAYLYHYKRLTKDSRTVTEAELDSLLEETLWFTLASHFKWAMWAVVQAARSEIHFGYMEYAVQRLEQYYKWKDALTKRFGP